MPTEMNLVQQPTLRPHRCFYSMASHDGPFVDTGVDFDVGAWRERIYASHTAVAEMARVLGYRLVPADETADFEAVRILVDGLGSLPAQWDAREKELLRVIADLTANRTAARTTRQFFEDAKAAGDPVGQAGLDVIRVGV